MAHPPSKSESDPAVIEDITDGDTFTVTYRMLGLSNPAVVPYSNRDFPVFAHTFEGEDQPVMIPDPDWILEVPEEEAVLARSEVSGLPFDLDHHRITAIEPREKE